MSSALRMVQPALGKQLVKMNFGGIGDKLKEAQAAQAAQADAEKPATSPAKQPAKKPAEKPAEKPAALTSFEPLAVLKNAYIPGRDGPVRKPSEPGDRPPREERLRAARRRARRIGRRSLLSASRLRRTDESGTQQRTLG